MKFFITSHFFFGKVKPNNQIFTSEECTSTRPKVLYYISAFQSIINEYGTPCIKVRKKEDLGAQKGGIIGSNFHI